MNNIANKHTKKFFLLEFRTHKNRLPTVKEICESILRHAIGNELEVAFLSTEMPVRFFLNGEVYTTKIGGTVGSPLILCCPEQ